LAEQIKSLLDGVEFNGQSVNDSQATELIFAGQALLNRASECAAEPEDCGGE
jgi:hypothetical protein